ncbi:uncharacterized protein LOC114724659 isoform X2 [Neltuma alba]|uniref:uncharacterized protein LOC114724609 isoform X2 n=1 Tax=Neltuma alba TaxID=207710 RepID=UPI0010A2B7B8|nr:uncharacterized protein LOC114724609 isoform X2 [Prosopis alba]XP_028766889.1 uncharacterized protein LOC114724659 isoform X2 [Prosopis alba]
MASAMEIGVKIRKMLIISIRACHRSLCNHPFLVGVLGCLIFLYRSFPFVFSILVSASPVLVCTAVLLGTLLSFGQPNTPEIEKEEEVAHDISSFQTGFSEGATVIAEKEESVVVKTHTESRGVIEEERSIEEASLGEDKTRNIDESGNLISFAPPVDGISQNFQNESQAREQMDRELCSFELDNKKEVHEEKSKAEGISSDDDAIEKQYVFVQKVNDDILDDENEETVAELLQTLKGDQLDFSSNSSWKAVDHNEEEDSLESGSDRAESSSPDASMADIMPMLEELHPLLDLEASQTAQLSRDESAVSEKSQKIDDGSVQSDEDTENRVEVEEEGVDDHDDEEEEGGKEDESKSAIKWTEDDQKNLMDLGTSELERNQRLENLIARRRARKMMVEKNLIDFESSDLPFNVTPITTTRRNPFDLLDDSYAAMGLPPIPGSAPSNLQPRRNPFDIPYDPNEEKPDLKGDSFEQEFLTFNQKDTFFRRHESFSFRPSVLGATKRGKQNLIWKPIFLSEQQASEGTSYPSFQRQLSEVSETNLSSVQDTESVSSSDQDERKFDERDLSQETELISNIDHASECVEIGSQSSGEIDPVEMIQVHESNSHHGEVEIMLGGAENLSEMALYPEAGEIATHEELNTGEIEAHLGRETVVGESNGRSSQFSLLEGTDNMPDEMRVISASLQSGDNNLLDSRDSVEQVDLHNVSAGVEGNQNRVPLYDSSPLTAGKFASFSSVSSDSATEFNERAWPMSPAGMVADVMDTDDHAQEASTSGLEENHSATSQLHMEVNDERHSGDSEDINQHDVNAELASVAPSFVEDNESSVPVPQVTQPVSVDSSLSSNVGSLNAEMNTDLAYEQEQADLLRAESEVQKDNSDDSPSGCHMALEKSHSSHDKSVEEGSVHYSAEPSRFDDGNTSEGVQDADEKLEVVESYSLFDKSSSNLSTPVLQDLQPSLEAEQVSIVHSDLSSEETRLVEKNSLNKEEMFEVERDKYEKLDLMASHSQHMSSSDSSMSAAQEMQPSLGAEQASFVHPIMPSKENERVEETSLKKDDAVVVEQDKLFLSHSFEQGNIDIRQGLDRVVSSSSDCQYVQCEVKSPSILDGDLPNADNSLVAPSFSDHDESQKSCIVQVESTETRDEVLPQISAITSYSSDTPGLKLPTEQVDSEVDKPGKVVNEMQEILNSSAEGYRSLVTEENVKESDELKEIDEGFLSELDTVGDFGISDAGVSLHPNLLPEDTTVRDAQVIQPSSVKDLLTGDGVQSLHPDLLPEVNTVGDAQGCSLPKVTAEAGQEIPFLEARSLEDIDLAFKQLKEGVDFEKVMLPSSIKDQPSGDAAISLYPDLLLVETADRDAQVSSLSEDATGFGKEIPLVEARSPEDIDSAFKRLTERADVKKVTLPSTGDQLSSDKSEEPVANSDFQVAEARSHDDTTISLEEISEGTQGELPEVLNMKDAPADIEVKEVGSAKMIESSHAGSDADEQGKLL